MKRIAILMVTVLLGLSASASAVHYFTRSQAERAVNYLNRQNELMIYCGYDYEIETYVLINEIWAERINSAYYELWIYGYDAYTGDEIYMPLDLQCVWLYGAGRMYNAAQYLRFRTSIHTPQIRWYIPPYHPYTRIMHRPGYVRSYHYDIHRHGWMPPSHPAYHGPHHGPHHDPHHDPHHPPLPPYYDRTPQTPAPAPTTAWTPGVEHPQISSTPRTTSGGTTSNRTATGTATETRSNSGTSTNTRSTSGTTTNTRSTSGTTTNTRSTSGTTTNTRSASGTTTNTRSTSGSTTTSRSTSSATTTSRSTNNTPTRANTGTTSRSSSTNTKSDAGTTTTTRSTKSNTTTTRSGNTGTTTRSTSGTTTTTRSSGTTTTTRSSGTTGTRSTSGSTTTRNR